MGHCSSCLSAVRSRFPAALLVASFIGLPIGLHPQDSDLRAIVKTLVANEHTAYLHRPPCLYTSDERSDRTRGHLWEEHIAEVADGKLRYLVAEDGHALPENKRATEIERLHAIAADPKTFLSEERARKDDEQHAMQMFDLLPRAFLFDNLPPEGEWMRIAFRPDPAYVPRSYEERILHGMSGAMWIDKSSLRLHRLDGKLDTDIAFGYGILAVVHSGSYFTITRDQIAPGVWKTTALKTDIEGRIAFFKTIARRQDSVHKDFQILPGDPSIPDAVQRLLQ